MSFLSLFSLFYSSIIIISPSSETTLKTGAFIVKDITIAKINRVKLVMQETAVTELSAISD